MVATTTEWSRRQGTLITNDAQLSTLASLVEHPVDLQATKDQTTQEQGPKEKRAEVHTTIEQTTKGKGSDEGNMGEQSIGKQQSERQPKFELPEGQVDTEEQTLEAQSTPGIPAAEVNISRFDYQFCALTI
jgi:hypothetical protein